jgi:lipid-A-disaccharide synthase
VKKIFIIAGEASGDLHGANLVKSLLLKDNSIEIKGWGGERMQTEGVEILKHYSDLAFMGFAEVLANLNTIRKNFAVCKQQITIFKPDAVVLIDYPGFNLRMAKWIKEQGIKVIYYISPQVWAWKKSRVKTIKKYVDKMMVILPFEKDFYAQYNYPVEFVGHPLLDEVETLKTSINKQSFIKKNSLPDTKKIIALLPGSRKQEVAKMLPVMLQATEKFTDYHFVLAQAPSLTDDFLQAFTKNYSNVSVVKNSTYALLSVASAALVTSGTATLETALFNVPQVVCYKGNYLSYIIAKNLVDIKYISLVNLILDKELVKELIQHDMNVKSVTKELEKLLKPENREIMLQGYQELIQKLGQKGASERAAAIILNEIN